MRPKSRASVSLLAVASIVGALTGCSSSASTGSGSSSTQTLSRPDPVSYAVGRMTSTFVDAHRPTPAWGSNPAQPSRKLVTMILYPAEGTPEAGKAATGATPNRVGKSYPLIVFSHGLGANPQIYLPLLTHLAAAGFVVAAPQFPLTSSATPGGPDAGDVVHQPADVSFVVGSMLKRSAGKTGTLAGMVDSHEVGAAGHSNGAITTLGLVGNTCCRDARIKAAAVLSGDMEAFPNGKYDLSDVPPILIVHGTADMLIPYEQGVDSFNAARGPKGLLTVENGDHGSAAAMVASSAPAVMRATTDFFDAYLRGDSAARSRLPHDSVPGVVTMRFAVEEGSKATIPTLPAPKLDLHATVTPNTNLTNGQQVIVEWNGFTAGKVINILQCSADDESLTNQAGCDFTHAKLLHPDTTGEGSTTMQVITGKVGTGTCDAAHKGCFIIFDNASSPDPASMAKVPISFAP